MELEDIGLYVSYGLFLIASGAAVVLPLMNAIKNPSGLLKSLMGVGGLVVLFILSYAVSGDEVGARAASFGIDASGSKLIGAGLILFYIVFAISVIGIIFSEIYKATTK